MSWAEIFKVNSDLTTPINTKIDNQLGLSTSTASASATTLWGRLRYWFESVWTPTKAGYLDAAVSTRASAADLAKLQTDMNVVKASAVTSMQVYKTAGTYTWNKPEGITMVRLLIISGGGNGGSYVSTGGQGGTTGDCGGGGGGSGRVRSAIFDVSAASSFTVVVGAGGGASSFGTLSVPAGQNGNSVGASGGSGFNGGGKGTGSVTPAGTVDGKADPLPFVCVDPFVFTSIGRDGSGTSQGGASQGGDAVDLSGFGMGTFAKGGDGATYNGGSPTQGGSGCVIVLY